MAAVPVFVIAYVTLSGPLGFPVVAPALLAGLVWLATRRALLSILTGLATSAAIWMLFAELLRVPLPARGADRGDLLIGSGGGVVMGALDLVLRPDVLLIVLAALGLRPWRSGPCPA